MSSLAIPPVNLAASPVPTPARKSNDPANVGEAASQFEALLIGQILHSGHESGGGWLGTPEDSASGCATDYAEQQFAAVMAKAGGLGIARMVERHLQASPSQSKELP
jgi:Rod binding domain-containing protein